MGADLILYWQPTCEPTEDRLKKLREAVLEYSDEDPQEVLEAFKEVDESYRDISSIQIAGMPYPYQITGGMSWGDEPTDSSRHFSLLADLPEQIQKLFHQWAQEDSDGK